LSVFYGLVQRAIGDFFMQRFLPAPFATAHFPPPRSARRAPCGRVPLFPPKGERLLEKSEGKKRRNAVVQARASSLWDRRRYLAGMGRSARDIEKDEEGVYNRSASEKNYFVNYLLFFMGYCVIMEKDDFVD